jgi:hypothetical protein
VPIPVQFPKHHATNTKEAERVREILCATIHLWNLLVSGFGTCRLPPHVDEGAMPKGSNAALRLSPARARCVGVSLLKEAERGLVGFSFGQ